MGEAIQVRALYDFEAQPGTGELNLTANDVLTVTRQDVGEGWWEGINANGECGLFPAGYVEVISSPPPSMPPPPLPEEYTDTTAPPATTELKGYEGDDWDDDWDDDDSSYSQQDQQKNQYLEQNELDPGQFGKPYGGGKGRSESVGTGRGTVRKSFNRFSTFVKSGGEAYIMGQSIINVPSDMMIDVVDTGSEVHWAPNPSPFTCLVASPKKESKMKGFKSYIAYQLTPSFNNIQVSRRYKQFDWLHERLQEKFMLVPVPPLPDKQISGRYQDEFIEHRMAQLQSWIHRICRHPVMSRCEVFHHFLTCRDMKKWKAGKRKAEKDELVGAHFCQSVRHPGRSLDVNVVEKQTESFSRFAIKMDECVRQLHGVAQEQSKKYTGDNRREFSKIAASFRELSTAFNMEPAAGSEQLIKCIQHTGDSYDAIAKMYDEQAKNDFEPMGDMLHEYKGMLSSWPEILQIHRKALTKKREYQKLVDEGKLSAEEAEPVYQRIDVISYATLAEIDHFQRERIMDYKYMMQCFLTAQIDFYQKIVHKLHESLSMYDNA